MALDVLCQEMHEAWKLGDATERQLSRLECPPLTVDGP